jgi:hypothetical protein
VSIVRSVQHARRHRIGLVSSPTIRDVKRRFANVALESLRDAASGDSTQISREGRDAAGERGAVGSPCLPH